jgi:malate permease and related proteins
MTLNSVIKEIISLFIIVLIGFYCGKKNIIDEAFSNGLSRLLLDVTTPLLIISSFSFSFTSSMEEKIVKAFVYAIIIFILTPLLVKPLLMKIEKSKRNILQFAMVFSNCGFMGFPLAQSVFGNEGVIYASIFNMVFNVFVWTYGVMLFNETKSLKESKKLLKNPGIISSMIGLLIMALSIKIPPAMLDSIKLVGGLTTPISMLIIGSLLSKANLKKLVQDIRLFYASFIKLILLPTILYLVTILFKENSIVIKTYILMLAMPAGAMTTLFAERFNKNKEYSALIVSLSTLLSMITIPVIIKYFL